jgi:hypothetical protein
VEIIMGKPLTAEVRALARELLRSEGIDTSARRYQRRSEGEIRRKRRALLTKLALEEAQRRVDEAREAARLERQAAERQHVYVIGAAGAAIKIGIAADVAQRCADLQTASPVTLRVYYHIEAFGGLARRIEREAHQRLAEYRLRGEWFDYDPYEAAELVKGLVEAAQ